MAAKDKYKIFFNPAGFVELEFNGIQTPDSVTGAVRDLVKWSKKLDARHQKTLILVNVTNVPKIDISGKMAAARQEAVKAMKTAKYDRIAVYGNVLVQMMVNTLVLIAGKRDKIRVLNDRLDALKWLKNGK